VSFLTEAPAFTLKPTECTPTRWVSRPRAIAYERSWCVHTGLGQTHMSADIVVAGRKMSQCLPTILVAMHRVEWWKGGAPQCREYLALATNAPHR
jgi:hypothetical protein